jgi:hypothetical protein
VGVNPPASRLDVNGNITLRGGNAGGTIDWADNQWGGLGDNAYIRYFSKGGESGRLELGISDNSDDDILLKASGPIILDTNTVDIEQGRLEMGAMQMVPLFARGTGLNNNENRVVILGNQTVVFQAARGFTVVAINRSTLVVESANHYDVYGDANATLAFTNHLNSLDRNRIVVITSYDAWEFQFNASAAIAMSRCGATYSLLAQHAGQPNGNRFPYALIGIPELGEANGIELMTGNASFSPYAEISTFLVRDPFSGLWSPMRR